MNRDKIYNLDEEKYSTENKSIPESMNYSMENHIILKHLLGLITDSYQSVTVSELADGILAREWTVEPHKFMTENLPEEILFGEIHNIIPYHDTISIVVRVKTDVPEINLFDLISNAVHRYPLGNIWTNGEEILCRTESAAEAVADLLEALYRKQGSEACVLTGYYNPEDDARNNEKDVLSGWYYITLE